MLHRKTGLPDDILYYINDFIETKYKLRLYISTKNQILELCYITRITDRYGWSNLWW